MSIIRWNNTNGQIRCFHFILHANIMVSARSAIVDRITNACSRFPVPARTCKVQTYKPNSTNILDEYELAVYERTVQVIMIRICFPYNEFVTRV